MFWLLCLQAAQSRLTLDDVMTVGNALRHEDCSVTALDLSFSLLHTGGERAMVRLLVESLQVNNSVQHLDLRSNGVQGPASRVPRPGCCAAVLHSRHSIDQRCVPSVALADRSTALLAPLFSARSPVLTLDLRFNGIGVAGAAVRAPRSLLQVLWIHVLAGWQ